MNVGNKSRHFRCAPLMSVLEIQGYLREIDLDVELEDITKPKPEGILQLFTKLISISLLIPVKEVTDMKLMEMQYFQNPEMHDHFIHSTKVFICMKYLCDIICVEFTILDLTRPDPEKVVKILSGIINFLRHKECTLTRFNDVSEKLQNIRNKQKLLHDKKNQAIHLQNEKEQIANEKKNKIQQMKNELEEKKYQMEVLLEQERSLLNRNQQLASQVNEKRRYVEGLKNHLMEIRKREGELSKRVVMDPQRMIEKKTNVNSLLTDKQERLYQLNGQLSLLHCKEEILQKGIRKIDKRKDLVEKCIEMAVGIERIRGEQEGMERKMKEGRVVLEREEGVVNQLQMRHDGLIKEKGEREKDYMERMATVQERWQQAKDQHMKDEPIRNLLSQKIQRLQHEKNVQLEEIQNLQNETQVVLQREQQKQTQLQNKIHAITNKVQQYAHATLL